MSKQTLAVHMAVLISLCTATVYAGDIPSKKGEATLRHFEVKPIQVFSFRSGIMSLGHDAKRIEARVDLFYNGNKGLGVNSAALGQEFFGGGGIVDMGQIALDAIPEAPESGYRMFVNMKKIKPGRSYCVRCGDGIHYARIQVVEVKPGEQGHIRFKWEYLPAGGRIFSVPKDK